MALTPDGRAAIKAILENEDLFPRVKDADLSAAAIKLARKQMIAAGLTREDLLTLKEKLGADMFEKTLDSVTPHHIKLLARRLDRNAPEIEVNTGSSALSYVRQILAGDVTETSGEAEAETPPTEKPAKNKYLGRKAFRTGR